MEAGATPSSLAITTTSFPNGIVGVAYSATLKASGGTTPYTCKITNGSLPTSLMLNPSNGTITETPTTAGIYNFIVQVSDSSTSVQSMSKPFSITVSPMPTVATLWPGTAKPAVAADPDTAAVELGVRFKSDVNGKITGIRFYKSTANSGSHIGRLRDSRGNLLAQATFTSETASGWQQVNFATPVSITANTIYIASYHTNVGRYSADEGYFATAGVDNPPLHALQDGANGPNGVYQYGSGGFSQNTYNSSNYWVDVVFTL